jgi:uncharacterized SAM-binding protein YcdF (DUF218 family)
VLTGDGRVRNATVSTATEALRMRDIAISLGIPTDQILLEERSNNTEQNVAFVKEMLQVWNIELLPQRIIAVTCPYHLERVQILLNRAFPEADILCSPGEDTGTPEQEKRNEVIRVANLRWQGRSER